MVVTRQHIQELIVEGLSIDEIAAQITASFPWEPGAMDRAEHRKLVWTLADLDGHQAALEGKRRWAQ